MKKDDSVYLHHILMAIERIGEYSEGVSAFAESEQPEQAEVVEVLIGDFDDFVPKMTDFAMILTAG